MAWPRLANGLGRGALETLAALLETVVRCWRE